MSKDYFKELAKKIEVDVPKHVDKNIMEQLPAEESGGWLKFGMPLALAASVAFVVFINSDTRRLKGSMDTYAISEMLENKEMYEQMDLLTEVEDVELTDEEWKVLLNEEESDV